MIYALLPKKTEDIYVKFLSKVNELIFGAANDSKLAPLSFTIDFEKATINAIAKTFPTTLIKGCLFHFKKAVNEKVRSLTGKKVGGRLRALRNLCYLPPDSIRNAYYNMKDSDYFQLDAHPEFQHVLTYFEKTWVGYKDGNGKEHKPLFSPNMWSVHDSLSPDSPTFSRANTTNALEGFHNGFNRLLGCSEPKIWVLIEVFRIQQFLTDIKIVQKGKKKLKNANGECSQDKPQSNIRNWNGNIVPIEYDSEDKPVLAADWYDFETEPAEITTEVITDWQEEIQQPRSIQEVVFKFNFHDSSYLNVKSIFREFDRIFWQMYLEKKNRKKRKHPD